MKTETAPYLACEQRGTYALLMMAAGMMGAYTYNLRGGVFCNAQTANIVMMSIAFGKQEWLHGCYYFIPVSAYLAGSFLSELLPSPVKRLGFLRWDTYLVAFETLMLFLIGFIPLSVPHQVVQVLVNFLASMQYNTFRQAEGIPMATTFCTNHVRQVGVAVAKLLRKGDRAAVLRGLLHAGMIGCFLAGGALLTAFCGVLRERAAWLILIPMLLVLTRLVHADLTTEHGLLGRKPSGH